MSIEALVNGTYKRFSESDRAVWEYLSQHQAECANLSIEKVAQRCCVSRSAVMRFAQKLGFEGFAELKLYIKMDGQKMPAHSELEHICSLYQNVMSGMCEKNCDALFEAFDLAKQHFIFGEGMVQASIKKEFKRIFMSAGHMFYDAPSGQEMYNLVPLLGSDDFCILVSVSGKNKKIVEIAQKLHVRGVTLMSITKNRENTLAHICDFRLYVDESGHFETPIHWQYESTTSYFILIDILFLKYLDYHQRKGAADEVRGSGSGKL